MILIICWTKALILVKCPDKNSMNVYDSLTDKDIVRKVNEIFYDKIYDHPWMSLYFKEIDKEFITKQQTDFIIGALGGPKKYGGRMPSNAHTHMVITDELFDLRQQLLIEALNEAHAPEILTNFWLKIDEAFRGAIVQSDPSQCKPRYATDEILNFPNPLTSLKKAS
ncbi:MAG: group 1 truncated hemoglobin [Bdellovibrionales bacterium]|nr:group 1 truncated hemoglobin [Bdellovibrionales bacterium]